MSTTTPEPTPQPTEPAMPTTPTATSEPIQLPDDHPLVTAFNALKNEVKTLKAERIDPEELKRLRDIEAATKTQAEKDAEELARLRQENEGYKTREQINAWKAEVAEATGVPANVLAGSTKEEIEAHAESLKPLIGQTEQKPSTVPTIGRQPAAPQNIPLPQQIAAAEQAGNLGLAAELKALLLSQ